MLVLKDRLKGHHPQRAVRTTVLTRGVKTRVTLPGTQEEDVNQPTSVCRVVSYLQHFGSTNKDLDAT